MYCKERTSPITAMYDVSKSIPIDNFLLAAPFIGSGSQTWCIRLTTSVSNTRLDPCVLLDDSWRLTQNVFPVWALFETMRCNLKERFPYHDLKLNVSSHPNVGFLTAALSNCGLERMTTIPTCSHTGRSWSNTRSFDMSEMYEKSYFTPCIVYAVINAENDCSKGHRFQEKLPRVLQCGHGSMDKKFFRTFCAHCACGVVGLSYAKFLT